MDFERTDLPSGITVVTERMPSVRSVSLGFWFRVGSRDESAEQAGCSHFLEHLLFKGTTSRTARQIAEEIDAVGGEMNAFTSKEYTCFYARLLDRDLPVAVDVLGDMLGDATNTVEDVEAERQVVLEEINIHLDSPDDLVHGDFQEALLGDHPLALETLGTMDSITGMDRETIHDYYLDRYRPENLTVAAVGNIDHDDVVRFIEDGLGDLGRPGGERAERVQPREFHVGEVAVRHRPTEQAHVVLGGRALDQRDPRRYAARVMNTILGGGMSSRLFQEVREQRGLAYSTYSYVSGYSDAGVYGAYAGTTPRRVEETLKVVREQLDGFSSSVTAEEVERAKGALKGGIVLSLEDTGSRMSRIGKMVCNDAEIITVDDVIDRIDAVDLDAVRGVADELLATPRTLAVVGPFEPDEADRFEAVTA